MGDLALLGAGIGFIIGAFIVQLIIDAAVLWFVANKMTDTPGGVVFKRCFWGALALKIWVVISIVLAVIIAMFVPILGVILGLIIWWMGSKAILEGVMEITDAFTILILYLFLQFALAYLTNSLGGSV